MLSEIRIVITLLVATLGSPIALASDRFEVPGTHYSVSIPGTPECEVHEMDTALGSIERHVCSYYDSELGGGYSIEYFSLPVVPDQDMAQIILTATASGAAESSASEITRQSETLVDGYPALEVTFLMRDKGFFAHVRYVLVGGDLVTVSVDGGKRMHDSPTVPAFLDSLRVSGS
ncbi:hypothetical protein [Luteimonas terricola]|uniref:DUF1795 domain-containing protein n=1 Tax=Luteimonas terricola TaxID=645597 RepID=A0ABQ2EQD0_9GAMM|nr:hypothetical protein [Luteimonas terricola]GGK17200.1 hypothetical protein GCM10011394_27990 [Luteimonas terricola]